MKAMILVVSPEECVNLFNGDLSLLIRKKFPKDYVDWVYIYCTKDSKSDKTLCYDSFSGILGFRPNYRVGIADSVLNGKVVARFWCDKVEEISKIIMYDRPFNLFETETLQPDELLKQSCLSAEEITKYFMFSNLPKESVAIHTTKLEIFDKPKEISEFYHHFTQKRCERPFSNNNIEIDNKTGGLRQPTKYGYEYVYPLTCAPRSGYCYIEI